MEFVLFNSLDCEIGRYQIECDELGYPLVLASLADNVELRTALGDLQPGDTIKVVEASNG
jgi:hypothetical protein